MVRSCSSDYALGGAPPLQQDKTTIQYFYAKSCTKPIMAELCLSAVMKF